MLRLSSVWIDLCDYWTVLFSGTTLFVFGCDFTSVAELFQSVFEIIHAVRKMTELENQYARVVTK